MGFTAFEAAVKEVAETGRLSFAARRRLCLALACTKKVTRAWSAYNSEDKGPQGLLKQANAYLKGKLEADKLYQAW